MLNRFSATGMSRRPLLIGAIVVVGITGVIARQFGLLALSPPAIPTGYNSVFCESGRAACWDPVTAGAMAGTVEYACYQPGFPGTLVASNLGSMTCTNGAPECTGANAGLMPVCRSTVMSVNPGPNNCPTTHPLCGTFTDNTCSTQNPVQFATGASALNCAFKGDPTGGRCYRCDTGTTGIDLKINGSDGTITAALGDTVMLTWTSTGVQDCDTGTSPAPFGPSKPKATSGSEQFTVTGTMTVGIHCSETSVTNRKVQDSVAVIVASSNASSAPSLCPQCSAVCGGIAATSAASLSSPQAGGAASSAVNPSGTCPAGFLPVNRGGSNSALCPQDNLTASFCPGGFNDFRHATGYFDANGCSIACVGCKTGTPTLSAIEPQSLVAQLIQPSPFLAAVGAPAVPVCSSTGTQSPTCPAGTELRCPGGGGPNAPAYSIPMTGCNSAMPFWTQVRVGCPAGQPITQSCLDNSCYRKYAADCRSGLPSCYYLLGAQGRYLGSPSCVAIAPPPVTPPSASSAGAASPSCPSSMQLMASGGTAGCLVADPGPNFCPGGPSALITGQTFTLSNGCTQTCFGCAASSASASVQCNRNGVCDANEGSACPDCVGNSAACVQCMQQFCGPSTCTQPSSSAASSANSSSVSSCNQGACATAGNAACKANKLACKPTSSASAGYVCQGTCGNGELDPGETCDAGNACGSSCCTSSCQISTDPTCASCMMSSASSASSGASSTSFSPLTCPAGSVAIPNGGANACNTVRLANNFCSGGPGDVRLISSYTDASGCNIACTGCATGTPNWITSSAAGGTNSSAFAWKCTKSDVGPAGPSEFNLFTRGTTTLTQAPFTSGTDYCVSGDPTAVHEYTCTYDSQGNFSLYHRDVACPVGWSCSNGACVQGGASAAGGNATIVGTCTDTDGGIDVRVKGVANGWIDGNYDACESEGADYIFESYCFLDYSPQNNTKTYHAGAVYMPCPGGTTCRDAACQ